MPPIQSTVATMAVVTSAQRHRDQQRQGDDQHQAQPYRGFEAAEVDDAHRRHHEHQRQVLEQVAGHGLHALGHSTQQHQQDEEDDDPNDAGRNAAYMSRHIGAHQIATHQHQEARYRHTHPSYLVIPNGPP